MAIATILNALNIAYGVVGNTVTISDSGKNKLIKRDAEKKAGKLEHLVADFDFSMVPIEARENIEQYCRRFQTITSSGRFFLEKDIDEFCDYYFQHNPQSQQSRSIIEKSLRNFMSSYDYYLRQNMTIGEGVLFRQIEQLNAVNEQAHKETNKQLARIEKKIDAFSDSEKEYNGVLDFDTREKKLFSSHLYTANNTYADAFEKVLFLHNPETDSDVTLTNLYVEQKYIEKGSTPGILSRRLQSFTQNSEQHYMLIEGNAGNGKTTFVEWVNYKYRCGDAEISELLSNREIITIRLRDIEMSSLRNGLFSAICSYLYQENSIDERTLIRLFESSVVILDGFDELCTIEKITGYDDLLDKFCKKLSKMKLNTKIIVTSRPNYIHNLSEAWNRLTLLALDTEQREIWMNNYKEKCKQSVAPHIEKYMKSITDKESIFNTPMVLYMTIAKAPEEVVLNNSWGLYHEIFYEHIRDTDYNSMTTTTLWADNEHPAKEYWDMYYRINEEIAYRMYQTGNRRLYVDSEEIRGIIEQLGEEYPVLKHEDNKAVVKKCHALCGFWKNRTEDGYLEFYHNDIRDFFMCEKIYREINALYRKLGLKSKDMWEVNHEDVIRSITDKMVELLPYDAVEIKTLDFLKQRTMYHKENRTVYSREDFSFIEYDQKYFSKWFQDIATKSWMLLRNITETKWTNERLSMNLLKTISVIVCNILSVYNVAITPLLERTERLTVFSDVKIVNQKSFICDVFNVNRYQWILEKTNFHGIYLHGACLIGANLHGTNFSAADLHYANLHCADLSDTNLYSTDLGDADLSEAKFQKSSLRRANLEHANLRDAVLYHAFLEEANLCDSDLRSSDLSYSELSFARLCDANLTNSILEFANLEKADFNGALLINADLTSANLSGADIRYADLCGAILINTCLPDGFQSADQREQIMHLKSLDIPGLKI